MCLHGKGFGSKTKDWIRVQCMEPASLTPWPCFPKQRKNHHHLPWPDALHRSPSHVCPGRSAPPPCLCQTHLGSRTARVSSPPDATYYQFLCICPEGRTPLLATNWGRAGRMDSGVRALVPVQAPCPPSSGPTSVQPPVHLSERQWRERWREATLVTGIARQYGLHPPGSHWRVVTYHLFDGSHS